MVTKKNSIAKLGDAKNYLKSPKPYNGLNGDFDIANVRVLTRLAVELSAMANSRISEMKPEEKLKELKLIPDDQFVDGIATIKMPLSTFGVLAKDYNDIRLACANLLGLKVYDESVVGTKHTWSGTNVFHKIEVENDTETGDLEVTVKINKDMANRIFTLSSGYSEYNRNIAIDCRMPRAIRLYQRLSDNRDLGVAVIEYGDLKNYLGILEHDPVNYGIITKDKYPRYSHFEAHVLKTCQKALKDLVDKGKLDFYFEYERVDRTPKKKSANPDAIRFTLLPPIIDADAEELKEVDYIDSKWEVLANRVMNKNGEWWKTYGECCRSLGVVDGILTIEAPSSFVIEQWTKFSKELTIAINDVWGTTKVQFKDKSKV